MSRVLDRVSERVALFLVVLVAAANANENNTQDAYSIIKQGKELGIRSPYVGSWHFDADMNSTMGCFGDVLKARGANVLAVDSTSGLVSWCEMGTGFNAIPGQLRRSQAIGSMRSMALSNRVIYGAARFRASPIGTWIYLHALGRETGRKNMVFSDGTYERNLFGTVKRRLRKKNTRFAKPTVTWSGLVGKLSRTASTYEQAFCKNFQNFPVIKASEIQDNGLSKVYPATPDKAWNACLDVIAQYDVVVRVSPSERMLVFSQGTPVPSSKSGAQAVTFFDVLMGLHVQRRGQSGSVVHLSFLSPVGLSPNTVAAIDKLEDKAVAELAKKMPQEAAASIVAYEFYGELATQLLYEDRWKDKLTRRADKEKEVSLLGR